MISHKIVRKFGVLSVGIDPLQQCLLNPGYNFSNISPSYIQEMGFNIKIFFSF